MRKGKNYLFELTRILERIVSKVNYLGRFIFSTFEVGAYCQK